MTVPQQIILLFFVTFLFIVEGTTQDVEPLKCYICSSEDPKVKENCLNINDKTPFDVCKGNETMCRKIEQQIYYDGEDRTRVIRQCATRGEPGKCLQRTGTYRYKTWYCECNGKLCNGANTILPIFSLTVVIISFLGCQLVL